MSRNVQQLRPSVPSLTLQCPRTQHIHTKNFKNGISCDKYYTIDLLIKVLLTRPHSELKHKETRCKIGTVICSSSCDCLQFMDDPELSIPG